MSTSPGLEAAALDAKLARDRLSATAHELQGRLAPARLLDEAVTGARSGANALATTSIDAAQRNPRVALGVAAATAFLLLRKPLGRLRRRIFRRRRETE